MKITDNTHQTKNMENRLVHSEKYNVFLGGSCGGRKSPTTWRNQVAIPLLTAADITYFNPQVETWTHDLIHKENKAKENSDWLLFMLESSTRGIVSLVEVAYLVGSGRSVILVSQEEREHGELCIKEDTVSALESDDIKESQQTLSSIISKHDYCQYFSVLEKGIHHVIDGLKSNSSSMVQNTGGNSYSGKGEKKPWNDFISKISSMFNRSHKHSVEDTGRRKRPCDLRIVPFQRYTIGIITADNDCNLVQQVAGKLHPSRFSKDHIYVAALDNTSSLVTDTLMQCSILLVVIPSTALGCSAMCKAAYLLSKHKRIVMCVQDITSTTIDNGNTILTSSAVDDFNRARAYIRDMGTLNNAHIYNTIEEAMNTTSQLVEKSSRSRRTSLLASSIPPIAEVC